MDIEELKQRLSDFTYMPGDIELAADALSQLQAENAELRREIKKIKGTAECGTSDSFLQLSDDDKRVWFALSVAESTRRKKAEEEVAELRRELEAQKAECATFRHGHRIASDNCVRLERDLEEARKTLEVLAAQSSGIPGSTAKSDCMASMASLALRNMSATRQQQGDEAKV